MKESKFRLVLPLLMLVGQSWGMEVDLFVHKDKFGKSLAMTVGDKECTNVPRLWANLTMSVDTHGSCMQFYDGKNCKGKIAVIQPFHTVHQMDLSLIQFHNTIQSVSACGAKVPSGRYVIQSAVDASILTVQKHENEFARVNTLPPQAFVPKAQQWEVSEKQANEYDIMPRIHETNYPITYDGDAMKRGSFIRKVWKIESVGRGRYVIKSEWTQKCLYKTRVRTVEEHDCRAWSPNQEWVLRPLIAPTKAPPTQDPQLADGVNFQVPSKVVDKYLAEQKRLREKNRVKTRPSEDNDEHFGAYLEPYRIVNRKNKNKNKEQQEENSSEEEQQEGQYQDVNPGLGRLRQNPILFPVKPPGPEVMYSQASPMLNYEPRPHFKVPAKEMVYMDGMSPVYEDGKVDDPIFPDFLLHAASDDAQEEESSPTKYSVTRKPFRPEPIGHPNYVPDKKKYDGRVKDKNWKGHDEKPKQKEESEEESSEDEEGPPQFSDGLAPGVPQQGQGQGGRPGGPGPGPGPDAEEEESAEEESQEDQEDEKKVSAKPTQSPESKAPSQPIASGHLGYQNFDTNFDPSDNAYFSQAQPPIPQGIQPQPTTAAPKKKKPQEEEQSQEDDNEGEEEESQEDDADADGEGEGEAEVEAPEFYPQDAKPKKDQEKESVEEGDDPARDVASFMKLLFQGINNKMNKKDKVQSDMADLLRADRDDRRKMF